MSKNYKLLLQAALNKAKSIANIKADIKYLESRLPKIKISAALNKAKSIANIKADIKYLESRLPKIKISAALNKTHTENELNSQIKTITPKVQVSADTTKAEQKIQSLGKKKDNVITIQSKVDTTQAANELKKMQEKTTSLLDTFASNPIGTTLISMNMQQMTKAISDTIQVAEKLDKIKTSIQMATNMTDSEMDSMMQSYNSMAMQLGTTTQQIATSANNLIRMGESVSDTNEIIQTAQMLSKIGMIDSADAASYLISSMKGYQITAENSVEILDKLAAVDMEAAVSAGGLAESLAKCAAMANTSGTSLSNLMGYMAVVGEATKKSMSEVGNSFQSIYNRMNNIKLGNLVDDETGESLADTENILNNLEIKLRDTAGTYRDFDDVLSDIGKNWDSFTLAEQNTISKAIGGSSQMENFGTLMNHYGDAMKYSESAANSAGTALAQYGKYQDSIEAKANELKAALESLAMSAFTEDFHGGILEATTAITKFSEKIGVLTTLGAGTGLFAGIKNAGRAKCSPSNITYACIN
ncbi:MAG: phage tail tape measure protein [Lachnospiraceae bacterium]|nr:phage tail tape measure protein [Lachnospiraceae bacterium]